MGIIPSSVEPTQVYSRQTDYGHLHFSSLLGLGYQFIDYNAMSSGSQAAIFYAEKSVECFLLTSEGWIQVHPLDQSHWCPELVPGTQIEQRSWWHHPNGALGWRVNSKEVKRQVYQPDRKYKPINKDQKVSWCWQTGRAKKQERCRHLIHHKVRLSGNGSRLSHKLQPVLPCLWD